MPVTTTVSGCTSPAGTATATLSQPGLQASIGSFTNLTANSVTVNWSRGNGDAVVVVGRQTQTTAAAPANATTYSASTVFGQGQTTGAGNYVVYNGAGTTTPVTGLSGTTGYTFTVYEYTSSGPCYLAPGSSSGFTTPTP